MAKTKVCPFCGKEYQDKFFGSSEAGTLQFGDGLTYLSLSCCSECSNKYENEAKQEGQRFSVKVANLKAATKKKYKDVDIAKMFCTYLAEKATYPTYTGEEALPISFCYITPDGHFSMTEFHTANSEYSVKQYEKSMNKIFSYDKYHMFSARDVSKLEFCQVGMKDVTGLFSAVLTYDVRLNDEKVMTYKPCIARFFVRGKGIRQTHSAEKEMRRLLEVFKTKVGVNLPITKVKKFK